MSETYNPDILTRIIEHPSWEELRKVADAKRDAEKSRIWSQVMREPLSNYDQAYTKGFMQGMQYLLNFPEIEAKRLKVERTKENLAKE